MEDFMDMAKKAQELAGIFNNNPSEDKSNQSFDMDNILKAMEMAKVIQSIMPENKGAEIPPVKENTAKTADIVQYFDDDLISPEIKSIKSAIPYLDYRYQRVLAVMVKMIETRNVMERFSEENILMQQTVGETWRKDMLHAIRPHMSEEKREMVDMLIMVMDLSEITEKLQKFRGNTYGI